MYRFLWKETKVLFYRVVVPEMSRNFRVINRIEIDHSERGSIFIVGEKVILRFFVLKKFRVFLMMSGFLCN